MRFLKNKIAMAQAHKKAISEKQEQSIIVKKEEEEHQQENLFYEYTTASSTSSSSNSSPKHHSSPSHSQKTNTNKYKSSNGFVTPLKTRETKSIVKNYGKAICGFACSDLAKSYLQPKAQKENVDYAEFMHFMENAKESLNSLRAFQTLLLITNKDSIKIVTFKKVFAWIGEVFIKFFIVNWIFSGKIVHKEAHLKARFKMLRRIRNPQFFTYLK